MTRPTETMCSNLKTINGFKVACGACDACANRIKNTWVARACAQKAVSNYSYAFTLTYRDNEQGEAPLGAKVFRYKDVKDFWKRLRSAAKRKFGENLELTYVVVGEKGTLKGRCHYHGVMFTSHPIEEIGHYQGAKTEGFAFKLRLDWSLWGHGFVEFQKADRKGMAYVLKYILKSRMTAARSKGQKREGKTEWLASSYLWCSKKPPVGSTWLFEKLVDLYARRMCPPSLRVPVPGGGEWYIGGELQKQFCLWIHEANKEHRKETGNDLAGFKTLVQSVSDELENSETGELVKRKPWEWLNYGEIEESETEYDPNDATAFEEEYLARQERERPIWAARHAVKRCGGIKPCKACRNSISGRLWTSIQQEYEFLYDEWSDRFPKRGNYQHNPRPETDEEHRARFDSWWQTRLRPSRGCAIRKTDLLQDQFRRLVALEKARHGGTHKAAIGKALQGKT